MVLEGLAEGVADVVACRVLVPEIPEDGIEDSEDYQAKATGKEEESEE